MVAWTHLGCQEEEDAVKTDPQVFERGRSAWRIQPAAAAAGGSPRLPHAGANNSLGFEHRECFEATAGVGLARVGLRGLATERLNRLASELEKYPENVTVERLCEGWRAVWDDFRNWLISAA
jgi:hypothetical protein